MQIHELTSRHQQTNEASVMGALKGAGAVLGGVAKQVGQNAMQKIGLAPDRFAGQRVAQGERQGGAAMAANLPALQLMAKQAQQAWIQTQQQLAQKANPPVASASSIPVDQLKPHLTALINQLMGFDYTKKPVADPKVPEMAMSIKTARDTIDANVDEILALTVGKTEKEAAQPLKAAWEELVIKGVGPMQTYQKTLGSTTPAAAAATATQNNPAATKLATDIGQTGMYALAQHVQNRLIPSTKIPAIDGLLTQLGAKLQ